MYNCINRFIRSVRKFTFIYQYQYYVNRNTNYLSNYYTIRQLYQSIIIDRIKQIVLNPFNLICSEISPNFAFHEESETTLNTFVQLYIMQETMTTACTMYVDCKVTTNGPASQPWRGDSIEMVYVRAHRRHFSFLPTPSTLFLSLPLGKGKGDKFSRKFRP